MQMKFPIAKADIEKRSTFTAYKLPKNAVLLISFFSSAASYSF
jgi:hypothetical protein